MKMAMAALALLACASEATAATPTRVSAGSFPISSLVVAPAGTDMVLVSGTTAPSPSPGAPVTGDTAAQTVAALTKIDGLLKAQGLGLGDIVMMRVYLVGTPDMGGKMDFAGMMKGYTQFFGTAAQPNKPARTTVQVVGLAAPGALVEIDAEAVRTH